MSLNISGPLSSGENLQNGIFMKDKTNGRLKWEQKSVNDADVLFKSLLDFR